MKKVKFLFLIIISGIILHGCAMTYGTTNKTQYTQIRQNNNSEKAKYIYLFYEGEKLNFDYIKIGEIETDGEKYANNSEILDHIKYEAWKHNANGLINIKSGYRSRTQGRILSDDEEVYQSKYYKAIAVNIKTDSTFLAKYGSPVDTTFVSKFEKYKKQKSKESQDEFTFSIIGGFIAFALFLIYLAKS